MKKIIGIFTVVLALAMLTVNVLALSGGTSNVPATVTVEITCGFTVTGNLNFANTNPGGSSDEKDLTLTNTGSLPITIDISGTDWCSGIGCPSTPTYSMPVGQTMYGTVTPSTALTSSGVALPQIGNLPSNTLVEHFQMSVPYGQAAGSYGQTVTFEDIC